MLLLSGLVKILQINRGMESWRRAGMLNTSGSSHHAFPKEANVYLNEIEEDSDIST